MQSVLFHCQERRHLKRRPSNNQVQWAKGERQLSRKGTQFDI